MPVGGVCEHYDNRWMHGLLHPTVAADLALELGAELMGSCRADGGRVRAVTRE